MTPLAVVPNQIELSDFSGGWMPDLEASAIPATGVLETINLLPDIGSGVPQVRKGFKRLAELLDGYTVQSIHPFNRQLGGNRLVVVATNEVDNTVGNVVVYTINLTSGAVTLVSPNSGGTPTKQWVSADARHYGLTVGGKFYGGGPGDAMYGVTGAGGWENAPAVPSYPEYNTVGTYSGTARPSDYAFEGGEEVRYDDGISGMLAFSVKKGNRFDTWQNGKDYPRFRLVSIKRTWSVGNNYWRSFRCKRRHTASNDLRPGDGTGAWQTYWRPVELPSPTDEDGKLNQQRWDFIPTAPKTNIAAWHHHRMWLRADDVGPADSSMQRVAFSAPMKPRLKSPIGALNWSPDDWRIGPVAGREGDGGGWEEFRTSGGDNITGLFSYGYYLLVFKRRSVFALATGTGSRDAWINRLIGDVGAVSQRAMCEFEGQVYFIGDQGFYRTDGTNVEEVPGGHVVRDYLRRALNWEQQGSDITMWAFQGMVWISLPTKTGRFPDRVLVYDPSTESFWKLDMEVQAASVNRSRQDGGTDQLFFSRPTQIGDLVGRTHAWTGQARKSKSTRTDPTAGTNKAAQFAIANSEYLSIADNTALSMGDIDFTIAGWAWFDTIPHGAVVCKFDPPPGREWTVELQDNELRFGVSSNGTSFNVVRATTFGTPPTGAWLFVVAWHDATADTLNIQVNNGAAQSVAHATGVFDGAAPVTLGRRVESGFFLDGRLDSWGVWKRKLTTEEKAWLYNGGFGRAYSQLEDGLKTNLQAWWDLEEASGTRVDAHSTNDLTDNNTVTQNSGLPPAPETNHMKQPSFEPANKGNTAKATTNNSFWEVTSPNIFVSFEHTRAAAMRGRFGALVTNKRKDKTARYEGLVMETNEAGVGTYTISAYVRKANWKKHPEPRYFHFRFVVGLAAGEPFEAPAHPLPEEDHTFERIGRGWYRVQATFQGSTDLRYHGFVLRPSAPGGGLTVHADKVMITEGATAPVYFDGDGSDRGGAHGVQGGDLALVYQYDHPDVQEAPTDDSGADTYEGEPIPWLLRTAWLPFGVFRQDRRIRRIWAMIRGSVTTVLRGYRNYRDIPAFSEERTPDEDAQVEFKEGKYMPDSFAVSFEVEGNGAPAAVLGVASDTQPRRARYHTPQPVSGGA